MHPQLPQQVGPLDSGTLAPARTLLLAKLSASALMVLIAMVGAIVLAPRVLAGVGALPPVFATVTSVSPVPEAESPSAPGSAAGRGCAASDVSLAWAGGRHGVARWCTPHGGTTPRVGGTASIWAIPGWEPVQASDPGSWLVFDIAALAVLLAGCIGTVRYGRDLSALAALRRGTVDSTMVCGRIDRISIGKGLLGKDGRVTIGIALDRGTSGGTSGGQADRPLRLALPGPLDRSLLGARVAVHALGGRRRGNPGGPYVLVRVADPQRGGAAIAGTRVALGRRLRTAAARVRAVGAIAIDADGRLLVIQRGHEPAKGRWSVPGGKVEPGETDEQALARELLEETGLAVKVGALAGKVERPGGPGVVFEIFDYDVVLEPGPPPQSGRAASDAAALRWVTRAELERLPLTDGLLEALGEWGRLPR